MTVYEFEIQNLIKVRVDAENKDDARMDIIENLERYELEMMQEPVVSDGEEVKWIKLMIF